jgi:hypothetical protein
MLDIPDRNMKNEKFCSQLTTYFKRHMEFLEPDRIEKEDYKIVLRAAGNSETTQENIQDWLELDEGYPGFQVLVFLLF